MLSDDIQIKSHPAFQQLHLDKTKFHNYETEPKAARDHKSFCVKPGASLRDSPI